MSLTVRAATGTISASPNPCEIFLMEDVCTSRISWSASGTSSVQVWVQEGSGSEQLFAAFGGGTHSKDAGWIPEHVGNYVFRLYDYPGGVRGALPASVVVRGDRGRSADPQSQAGRLRSRSCALPPPRTRRRTGGRPSRPSRRSWENRRPVVAGEDACGPFRLRVVAGEDACAPPTACLRRGHVAGLEDGRLGRQHDRGRTASPWSQAGRLRSPGCAPLPAVDSSPDRRTAVSAVEEIAGEPSARGRRRDACAPLRLPVVAGETPALPSAVEEIAGERTAGKLRCDLALRKDPRYGPERRPAGTGWLSLFELQAHRDAGLPDERGSFRILFRRLQMLQHQRDVVRKSGQTFQ